VNEVEPLSSRIRDGAGSVGAWIRNVLASAWGWFTDLGQGAWMLAIAVLVVAGIGLALVAGRHPEANPCDQAAPIIQVMSSDALRSGPLSARQASILHNESTELQAIAGHAFGSNASALRKAATVAGDARAGHSFDPEAALEAYDSACDFPR
jgi:hypothetical protein